MHSRFGDDAMCIRLRCIDDILEVYIMLIKIRTNFRPLCITFDQMKCDILSNLLCNIIVPT